MLLFLPLESKVKRGEVRGALAEENWASPGFWAFFDRSSEVWGYEVTAGGHCKLGMMRWKKRRPGEEEEDGEVFLKNRGNDGSWCLCEGWERIHCEGRQTGVRIWDWYRDLSGGCDGVAMELDGVWDGKHHGPLLPSLHVLSLDRGCPLHC